MIIATIGLVGYLFMIVFVLLAAAQALLAKACVNRRRELMERLENERHADKPCSVCPVCGARMGADADLSGSGRLMKRVGFGTD